jgi:hypothetical protein
VGSTVFAGIAPPAVTGLVGGLESILVAVIVLPRSAGTNV